MIEISYPDQLDAMRHDPRGWGNIAHSAYAAAFPNPAVRMGCPESTDPTETGCNGYELADDIDLAGAYSPWTPIPAWEAEFDGNRHSVSNMTTSGAGLFGSIGEKGDAREVWLKNATVTFVQSGVRPPYRNAGVLAGMNEGGIRGSKAEGSLTFTGIKTGVPHAHVGGLVGRNYGTINASWAGVDVAVVGGGARAGGFVGDNRGTITASFASGDVTVTFPEGYADGEKYNRAGGFVGVNAGRRLSEGGGGGIIRDSMAVGAVAVDGGQDTRSRFGPVCFRGAQFINVAHDPTGCRPRE